ncbi:helix-turn-helix domain-containing protein [Nocardia neocaledoniensis]|uniref:helix-turn-helix domain-containing protein n=1 Tax=Nocardia neocaledoniensis TaxID=236511 RepID=UPI002453F5AC|nr:helix-turn-helix domain-containing protein [Nocardia neocaledoniensis]
MPLLTSREVADIVGDRTGLHPTTLWVRTLAAVGILADHGTGVHVRVDADDLAEFLATHPYRPTLPFDHLAVSVGELTADPQFVLAPPHPQWRSHAGYDHHNTAGLSPTDRARAITGAWRLGTTIAEHVVDAGLPLVASVKGVITPDLIYWPRAVIPLTGGTVGFDVDPEHRGHDGIGTGAITDVPRGNVWRLVTTAPESGAR